ncbi:MAG: LpqB family beta-propeller domain-containing protein [Gemmatimonadales bacterium]
MIPAPIVGVRNPCGLPPWTHRYLYATLAVIALIPAWPASAQTVSEVQVTPETMTLGVGQKQTIFATAFDQRGNLIASAKISFWSSDTLVAQVQKDGTVLGVSPGLAKIEARSLGRRASLAVLITGTARGSPGASVLTLEPPSIVLLPGENTRVYPQALREDGKPAPLGRTSWRSLRPEIASVDSLGNITGVGAGRTIVQVTTGRLMATLPVEVAPADFVLSRSKLSLAPDDVDTLRVLVPSQGNREIRSPVQWRSTDSTVVSVSPTGIVRARAPGQAEIVAAGASQERKVSVSVHQLPEALVVSPHQGGTIEVPLRSTRQFTAEAQAADSSAIPEAKVTWQLSDSGIATFDVASGTLTPKTLGTTTLTATLPGITPAVWTVRVIPGDILLDPSRAGLLVGQRISITAFLRDDQGNPSNKALGVRWSSDRPEVALAREGAIDALSVGHAVVTATAPWGKSASADVYVMGDLLVVSNRSGPYGIYQMRSSAPGSLLPVLVDSATNLQAVLAPDRTRVAFSSNRAGANYDIYVVDADGRNLRRLTSNPGNEGDPAWMPDGKHIVYTSTTGSTSQLAIVSTEGSDNRQLTFGLSRNTSPAVSADGRTIAFVSSRDGNQEIYTMSPDGSNQRRITKSPGREWNPRFFPAGDLLYVAEGGGKSKGSRVMRGGAAGSAGQLFVTEQPISSLGLSRDGERLAYVIGRITDASKGRVEFSVFLQSTAPGSPPVAVPLRPGEQILTPSF